MGAGMNQTFCDGTKKKRPVIYCIGFVKSKDNAKSPNRERQRVEKEVIA
jgi:CDGSH-type Zn-finger protein